MIEKLFCINWRSKSLTYLDLSIAVGCFAAAWYLGSLWWAASGVIALFFAWLKPMALVHELVTSMVKKKIEGRSS